MRIDLETDDAQIKDAFAELEALGRDLRPVWQSFAEVLQASHMFRWGLEVAPNMKPWEPLAPVTIRRKREKGAPNPTRILYEEGDLLRGLVTDPGIDELEFGVLDLKAPIHHFGTDDIPARGLVGLSPDDRAALLEILHDEIEDRWR